MKVEEIQNKEIWENFLSECREKTFLQSWNWGKFQKNMGNKIWRLGFFEENELIATALVSKVRARRGTFLLIQHGPSLVKTSEGKAAILKILSEELKKIGKEEGASFIRMNPLWERNQENQDILNNFGFRGAPMHANAYESTLKLNLSKPEEEILMGLRKTTRYLIRQALKNPDFEIIKSNKTEDVALYDKLNQGVAKNQQFVPFSFKFIKNEFDVFRKDNQVLLFFGKYQGKVVASALIVFWSDVGFYHQAALDPGYHKIPISYLLVWEAIKEAKKRGCLLFDFWGYVDPFKNPGHPWAGPTLFKMGFGGELFEYVRTRDLPLSKKYWLTYFFEKLRKTKRGL